MRTAILTDIHSNLEALNACIEHAQQAHVDGFAFLGDIVGYNASPNECVKRVRSLDCPTIQGNHDHVAAGLSTPMEAGFNPAAEEAIVWTGITLLEEHRQWLEDLPWVYRLSTHSLLCHGSPRDQNEYILTTQDMLENADYVLEQYTGVRVVFFGHTHIPAVIRAGNPYHAEPEGETVKLDRDDLTFVNPGSVGQPRDGRPQAAFVIYDDVEHAVEFVRVGYNIDAVTMKNEAAEMNPFLSERLRLGI